MLVSPIKICCFAGLTEMPFVDMKGIPAKISTSNRVGKCRLGYVTKGIVRWVQVCTLS